MKKARIYKTRAQHGKYLVEEARDGELSLAAYSSQREADTVVRRRQLRQRVTKLLDTGHDLEYLYDISPQSAYSLITAFFGVTLVAGLPAFVAPGVVWLMAVLLSIGVLGIFIGWCRLRRILWDLRQAEAAVTRQRLDSRLDASTIVEHP